MYISSHIMYILFISLGGIWQMADVIFFSQFNNNSNKKKFIQPMSSTRPMWVGLDLRNRLGLVEFFLTHYSGLDQKIFLTRPNPTHARPGKVCIRKY